MNGFTRNHRPLASFTLVSALMMLLAACLHKLPACPFCLSPPQTLAEQIARADIVLIAELVRFRVYDEGTRPESTLRIREYVHGQSLASSRRELAAGQSIVIASEATGKPGDLFLMYGSLPETATPMAFSTFQTSEPASNADAGTTAGGVVTADLQSDTGFPEIADIRKVSLIIPEWISWNETLAVTDDVVRYIKGMPATEIPQRVRLEYFIPFLEHRDPLIAIDAWAEFGNSSYEDVVSIRDLLSPENLRAWIADPQMSPERLGLYGMMLGLCGHEQDATFLLEQMYDNDAAAKVKAQGPLESRPFRFGAEGLMGGYLLLNKERGLEHLEQVVLTPQDVPETAQHAMVQALQFMWSYESDVISQARVCQSMRMLLHRASMREIAITNLSRWEDWETLPALISMFEQECADDRPTRRAILQFAQICAKSGRLKASSQPYAAEAELFLCSVHANYPELFSANSREFHAPQ